MGQLYGTSTRAVPFVIDPVATTRYEYTGAAALNTSYTLTSSTANSLALTMGVYANAAGFNATTGLATLSWSLYVGSIVVAQQTITWEKLTVAGVAVTSFDQPLPAPVYVALGTTVALRVTAGTGFNYSNARFYVTLVPASAVRTSI